MRRFEKVSGCTGDVEYDWSHGSDVVSHSQRSRGLMLDEMGTVDPEKSNRFRTGSHESV